MQFEGSGEALCVQATSLFTSEQTSSSRRSRRMNLVDTFTFKVNFGEMAVTLVLSASIARFSQLT